MSAISWLSPDIMEYVDSNLPVSVETLLAEDLIRELRLKRKGSGK